MKKHKGHRLRYRHHCRGCGLETKITFVIETIVQSKKEEDNPPKELPLFVKTILAAISVACGITLNELLGTSRKERFVRVRRIVIYVLRHLGFSQSRVSVFLNKKDHTPIKHSWERINELREMNKELQSVLDMILHYCHEVRAGNNPPPLPSLNLDIIDP